MLCALVHRASNKTSVWMDNERDRESERESSAENHTTKANKFYLWFSFRNENGRVHEWMDAQKSPYQWNETIFVFIEKNNCFVHSVAFTGIACPFSFARIVSVIYVFVSLGSFFCALAYFHYHIVVCIVQDILQYNFIWAATKYQWDAYSIIMGVSTSVRNGGTYEPNWTKNMWKEPRSIIRHDENGRTTMTIRTWASDQLRFSINWSINWSIIWCEHL